jgi:hypothetical protein
MRGNLKAREMESVEIDFLFGLGFFQWWEKRCKKLKEKCHTRNYLLEILNKGELGKGLKIVKKNHF